QLVAVKILSKSNLKRRRTIERDRNTKSVKIRNAYQQVQREIALMKKLSHPNLVQLYEVIDSPETDILYMVLEYMPLGEILTYQENTATFKRSESLRHKKIDGLFNGHFDEEHAALYFVDILHGLAYLHQHHICHRDLKPENILLSNRKIAKIGDFGVSHIFEEESENGPRRMTEGTWCFWSPEMCNGSRGFSLYAADIWAAGICLYIFVTGKLPFYSTVPLDLFEMIAKTEIQYSDLGLSDTLIDLLKCCLEKDPNCRAGVGDCLHHPF
ncbi:kinase-like protein, partial [Fragilariopsis cylindrus CCMP1102]